MTAENSQSVFADSSIFSNTGNVSVVYNFGSSQSPVSPSKPPPFVLPVRKKSEDFTGRGKELKRLEELLLTPEGKKLAGIVGLAGTGGIGKSALAFHFAEQHQADFPDGVIGLQVNGKEPAAIVREFARTAKIPITEDDTREPAILMQEVFAGRRMLLIFDNAETREIGELHPGGKCAVIVTTRDRSLPGNIDAELVEVLPLPAPEARILLSRFVGEKRLQAEPEAAARILEVTGNLPLAVEIAGKTLQARLRLRLENYAEDLKLDSLKLPRDSNFSVLACFMQSIRLLEAEGRKDLIECFARLAACAQSGFALATAMAAAGEADEHAALEKLDNLVLLSLLNYADGGADRFMFHPLLHEFAGELAKERNLLYLACRQHANYLIGRLRSQEPEALTDDLEDFVRVAEWLTESEDEGYVAFYLKLKSLFERLGHWQRASRIISQFVRLAEIKQDWLQIVLFQIQQAKFILWQGNACKAEELLLGIKNTAQKIEPQEQRQRSEAMRLTTLGGVYQRQGDFDNAVQAFQQSVELEEQLGNQRGLAVVLNSLGSAYQRLGRFEEAVQVVIKGYELSVALEDQRGQAMLLNSLGGVYQRQGKFEEAVHAFARCSEIEEKLNNQRGQAMVLNSLGGVYQRQGKFDDAVQAFRQSYDLLVSLKDERGQAMVLNSLGGVYQRQGKFDEAVQAFRQSYDISSRLKDERSLAMVLNSLGGVYQRQGNFDDAVQAFRQSYDISSRLEDERSLAMVLNSLGGVYQRQGNFDDAVQAFRQSYDISFRLEDERSLAMVLNSLGGVYQRQGKFDDAVQAFRQSYDLLVSLKDERGQAMVLNSLGGVYQRQGKFDDAVQAFRQSYDLLVSLKDERGQAMVLNSLGGVYQRQGKFDDAVQAFRQSYDLLVSLKDERGQAMVLNSLGGVYQRQGKFDDAVQAFRQSYDLLVSLKDERGQAMVLNSLGGAYQLQERFAEAAEFFSSSAAIGEKLDDRRHLAMVCTAWGRALLRQHQSAQALAQLERGFSIDEQMKNGRGMEIVTPLLCQALQQSGRNKEAAAFCNRALAVAPGNAKLLALQKTLEQPQLTGTVKFISPAKDGGHSFGYITMDDGSEDVRVDSRFVDISGLSKGARVAVEIKTNRYGGRVARSVTIIAAMAQP